MEFLLTRYIYPIPNRITLSKRLGFCLDNPRTEFEISVVKDYLMRAYESGYDYKFPPYSDEPILSLEYILLKFRDKFSGEDQYIAKLFQSYERENIFEFIAGIWIIVRFDDGGLGEELRKEHKKIREEGQFGFFMLEDDNPILVNERKLADYCHLMSLLIHSQKDEYNGWPFLIESERLNNDRPTERIWHDFLIFGIATQSFPGEDELNWLYFPYVREKIKEVSESLESAFEQGVEEKLLYVGSILKIAAQNLGDVKTRIVVLTSIIELLLTHNPDFNRFNVEDSINKQFQLKASILICLNDKNRDINNIKRRLRIIYT